MNTKQAGSKPITPLVSIVVLAYNHLQYTRECIESIYQYTSQFDFELITVNNGSTDETEDYFNSLPNSKKISFPDNIGAVKAFNRGFEVAEGKYTINLSNDIVVTTHWLNNLITCMESDTSIGMVVPVCNASCNYQQINPPAHTMEEIQKFAESYNKSNPFQWEEKLKLCNYAAIYPTSLLHSIGGIDEDFNPGSFDDDAICFKIRRMGYKVIFAKDTFVHHYGARSFNIEYEKDKTLLVRNRNLFMQKFNADPAVAGTIDYSVLGLFTFRKSDQVNILGIGSSYGTTVLQLKNMVKSHENRDIALYYLTEKSWTLPDLKTICTECAVGTPENAQTAFKASQYDYIVVESDSTLLKNKPSLYPALFELLKPGGQLVITASSPSILYETMGIFYQLGASFEKHLNAYYLCFSKKCR